MNKHIDFCCWRPSYLCLIIWLFLLGVSVPAQEPAWWTVRNVKIANAAASDFSMANQGQAKWFALQAEAELMANLPLGFNGKIYHPTTAWPTGLPPGDNYLPINQGQLKNLVQPLYDRINSALAADPNLAITFPQGMTGNYPWSGSTSDPQSFAPVNLGQLKYLLSFKFTSPPTPTVNVTATVPTTLESGSDPGIFTVTRTGGDQSAALTVSFQVGGTAAAGVDYQSLGTQVVIPANQSSATVLVQPLGSSLTDIQTVVLSLVVGTGYTLGPQSSDTVNIIGSFNDSTGTEFWVAFNKTIQGTEISLDISGASATTGTVSIPGLQGGFNQPFTITPGLVTTINIPIAAMVTSMDTVESLGIHVTAGKPVSVYGINFLPFASEAFTCYPSSMLGKNYCVMARAALLDDFPEFRSQFAIVATKDNTTVTITPSPTAGLTGHGGVAPYTKILHQGQTYQINSDGFSGDVTGTSVTSDKPIAVFAGADLARVPTQDVVAGNPLIEEQLPVSLWDNQALGFPLATRLNGDSYRVLAAFDNTTVSLNGVAVATLQNGQFLDEILAGPMEFKADKPIQVAQFSNGNDFDGTTGDPFEILLPPSGHYLKSYTVSTPTGFDDNFLNIFVEQSELSTTLVDGQPVSASSFQPIGNSGYVGAQVSVGEGVHTITSPKPVGVQIYGFASFDGYGYLGGIANYPLVAVPDNFTAALNVSTTVDVLANDIFSSRSTVSVSILTAPNHGGTASVDANKNIIYKSASSTSGFNGNETFTYQITENGITSSATVTIFIDPPVAVNDQVFACSENPMVLDVLNNDSSPNGTPLTIIAAGGATHGKLTINTADNPVTITYSRFSGEGGFPDSFAYTIEDGRGATATAIVSVSAVLTANNDTAQVFAGEPTTILVLDNDSDQSAPITAVTQGVNGGTVTISADQKSIIYTSPPDIGSDQFTYSIGECSTTATVDVTINAR